MNPKKSNNLYTQVAEDLNIDKDLVESLTEFYYKEVRNLLTNLSYPRINVDGLGHFVAKPFIVNKTIDRISKGLESHDTSTFKAYYNKKAMEVKAEALSKLKIQIDKEIERKNKFIKNKKNEGSSKDNLGE
jgi:4-alpha-glucanotransferase